MDLSSCSSTSSPAVSVVSPNCLLSSASRCLKAYIPNSTLVFPPPSHQTKSSSSISCLGCWHDQMVRNLGFFFHTLPGPLYSAHSQHSFSFFLLPVLWIGPVFFSSSGAPPGQPRLWQKPPNWSPRIYPILLVQPKWCFQNFEMTIKLPCLKYSNDFV